MDKNYLLLIELLAFGGIVLGFAFRELWLLRRDKNKSDADNGGGDDDPSKDG